MVCKLEDLKFKSVINIKNGANLGHVSDVVMDTSSAEILSLVIYGRRKLFGILGREDDTLIDWCDINIIGDDVVLVNLKNISTHYSNQSKKRKFFTSLFN